MEKYTFEGVTYNVAPHRLEEFLQKYPGAVKVEEPGKMIDSAIADPMAESNVTGSDLGDGSLELPETKSSVVKDIDTSPTGLFFNVFQQTQPNVAKPLAALASLAKGTIDIVDSMGDAIEQAVEIEFGGGVRGGG